VYAAHFTAEDNIRDPEFYADIEEPAELDEYEKVMDRWHDAEYLHRFNKYRKDLSEHSPELSLRQAIARTMDEATDLDREFLKLSEGKNEVGLDALFRPLYHVYKTARQQQQMKVYGTRRKSWLRLYALKYGDCYLITGGSIKLTQTMNTRRHLESELYKLGYAAHEVDAQGGVEGYIDL